MQENKGKKTFLRGAMLLGIAGVIVKMIGALFRVPLTNIIDTDGMGYYQMAYPVYVLVFTISTSGIPVAISRMISERRAQAKYYEAYRVFKVSFWVMLTIGLLTSTVIFVIAPFITGTLQHEPLAVYALRATAPALLICPILSCYRGFFQGQRNMAPTAVSQIVEQVFRVGVGLFLAFLLMKIDRPHAAAGASFGAAAGAAAGLITVLFIFQKQKSRMEAEIRVSGKRPEQPVSSIVKDIFTIAIPITIGSCIMPILNSIDTFIVKRRLTGLGYTDAAARSLFSELSALGAPIVNVPQVITQSVCQSLVPVISDAHKRGDTEFVKANTALGLRYALLVAMPSACGIIVLSKPIMQLLYRTQVNSIDNAAVCMSIAAFGMIFFACNHAFTGVLQGIGKQSVPVRNLVIGGVIKIIATYLLMGIPAVHVRGAAIGTALAYAVSAYLNFVAVKRYTGTRFDIKLTIIKPFIATAVMGVVVFAGYRLLHARLGNTITTFLAVVLGIVVYALMLFITRAISAEELEGSRKLAKIAKILKKIHLLR